MTRTACLNSIYELAKKDERVVFIGSDLSPNTMLDFKRDFPDRFFMEGVQEQNIIGMAAGLAKEGFIPYVNTIATFLTRRCYEQIAIDVCVHNLPVRLIGNGGGLVYAPLGATHCAIDDIAIMRALPNMTVVAPSDNDEMRDIMMLDTLEWPHPMYIRLGKDSDPKLVYHEREGEVLCPITLISTGRMSAIMREVQKILAQDDIFCDLRHFVQIKPLPDFQVPIFTKLIVTAEEGIVNGGLGTAILEAISESHINPMVLRLGLPDAFPCHYGEQEDLFETYGLTPEKIAKRIRGAYARL